MISETSIIDSNSSFDTSVDVGDYSKIESSTLGKNVKIGDFSKIKNSILHHGVKAWHYANIYGVEIGENTSIGAYVEIQSGAKIGKNIIISSHSFICDLVTIEDEVFIGHGVMTINDLHPPSRKRTGVADWRSTIIRKGAVIGSNVTLMPVEIGEYALVGAGSVVTKDVPARAIVIGNPAKIIGYVDK